MIISVSRRTDIPSDYPDWFYQRVKERFACVRNPMNPQQVRTVSLAPEDVDCFVFWTKNPEPMMARLEELEAYAYYFQFTLTGYGTDIEPRIPHKRKTMIPVFQRLSEKIGADRVIWRYDPILFNKTYTPEYHLNAFGQIAEALNGYTKKCVISFVDEYLKNKKELKELGVYAPDEAQTLRFAKSLADAAGQNGMEIASCAEAADLSACGITHNRCVDPELIARITGRTLKAAKDPNQRKECGCMASVDIGAYHTCGNGCRYCYANSSAERVAKSRSHYDETSPILCGALSERELENVRGQSC